MRCRRRAFATAPSWECAAERDEDRANVVSDRRLDHPELGRDHLGGTPSARSWRTPVRDRFSIDVADGGDMEARGDIVEHEYSIERAGTKVAQVSKSWFRMRDTYGTRSRRPRTTRSSSRWRSASTRWPTMSTSGRRAFAVQRSGISCDRSSSGRGPKMRRSLSSIATSLMLASRLRMRPFSSNSQSSLP